MEKRLAFQQTFAVCRPADSMSSRLRVIVDAAARKWFIGFGEIGSGLSRRGNVFGAGLF
jgi:hypothetical protein